MRRQYLLVKSFFVRNYEAIKLGLLAAILLTTLFMLNGQARTMKEILNINEQIKTLVNNDNIAREEARAQSQARDEVIIKYLKCIALIKPENRTQANIQECVDHAKVQTTNGQRDIADVTPSTSSPESEPPVVSRQTPTTSEPPEQPKPQPEPEPDTICTIPVVSRVVFDLILGRC